MTERRFLLARNDHAGFRDEVNSLLADGWRLVPGGLSIASAGYAEGDHWFGAVLERPGCPPRLVLTVDRDALDTLSQSDWHAAWADHAEGRDDG